MMIAAICFYVFATIAVVSGVMVITARNPVHAVLWLILAFVNGAFLFILLGAEFLAMVLVVVYVGAVAVLFLFVVMMLDVNLARLRQGMLEYAPLGVAIGVVLLAELVMAGAGWVTGGTVEVPDQLKIEPGVSNTEALGRVLYTDYLFVFETAGVLLLVGMVGAILLTLRHRSDVRRQKVTDQVARDARTAIEVRKVNSGEGLG